MESPLKAVADVGVPPLPLSVAGGSEELAAVLEAVPDGIAVVTTWLYCLFKCGYRRGDGEGWEGEGRRGKGKES